MTTEAQMPVLIIPTHQELNALVLTSCFGWQWRSKWSDYHGQQMTVLHAGDNDPLGYAPSNYYTPEWKESNADAPRFNDWHKNNIKHDHDGVRATFLLPDFCRDRNLVAEHLYPLVRKHFADVQFVRNLGEVLGILPIEDYYSKWAFALMQATPSQQVEAFLKTFRHYPTHWGSVGAEKGKKVEQ